MTEETGILSLQSPPPLSYAEIRRTWKSQESGDEILLRDPPSRRYSAGALYPAGTSMPPVASEPNPEQQPVPESSADDEIDSGELTENPELKAELDRLTEREGRFAAEIAADEADSSSISLTHTNDRLPSAVALSFLANLEQAVFLVVNLPGKHPLLQVPVNARYERFTYTRLIRTKKPRNSAEPDAPAGRQTERIITAGGHIRRPVQATWRASVAQLMGQGRVSVILDLLEQSGLAPLQLQVQIISRPAKSGDSHRLLTVSLINRTSADIARDCATLFQTHMTVELQDAAGQPLGAILPYPESRPEDPETRRNALLYREVPSFASGHGCAADWETDSEFPANQMRATRAHAEFLPFVETPSITPDIEDEHGQPIRISMRTMAGLDGDSPETLIAQLQRTVELYSAWVTRQEARILHLQAHHQGPARLHLQQCRLAQSRMQGGITYLQTDPLAWQAFQLTNNAILLQQIRSRLPLRIASIQPRKPLTFDQSFAAVSDQPGPDRGQWRAFQIAFLLLSVASTANGDHPDREMVDLIFFPTGGGKTEAYLGLTAFSSFLRRLREPSDAGVEVLMRYTLRLLTAQQFQRAASLMCAMEYLRRQSKWSQKLGPQPFTVGIWLGGAVTPNSRRDAQHALKALKNPSGNNGDGQNPFMLRRCPWCGAEMGVKVLRSARGAEERHILGYTEINRQVILHCSDPICDFHLGKSRNHGLPVLVTDEEVYETRPTLVIATVDKFAQLAWNPESRALFGLGRNGQRQVSPPNLIVQDELHLISGPLGSMTGLLEPVIEHLCTKNGHKPKIVCSTATIRAYREQVRDLYGRMTPEGQGNASLFPPPGLEASDAFFATYARERDSVGRATGPLLPGRMYVGVTANGFSSLQLAQIKTYGALLNAPMELPAEARDPWWTLLAFFGSLQELGTTLTLLRTYVPSYLETIRERYNRSYTEARQLFRVEELTGRLTSEEVPEAIEKLEERYLPQGLPDPTDAGRPKVRQRAVDFCLASSIIEVGVDIPRLSLMTILSQPKTTAQYIQVSGRVGREWLTRPGLVVTVYSPTRPRDRSHFERFRTYHQQLYAQVEPTSVTPFSPQAMKRGLHLAMVAFVRQYGPMLAADGTPGVAYYPRAVPWQLLEEFAKLMRARIDQIDPRERPTFEVLFEEKKRNWENWQPEQYEDQSGERIGLISRAGSYVPEGFRNRTWLTPNSLRNVDANCEGTISSLTITDQNAAHSSRSVP
ncbi:helicase (plasmid) [Deinococcus psychrotolerans]|uniref:Helicase n=1 Tax=Deinococcus psychrotolerans TaxID=2489213 RepID=A0A3G8YIQ1_9DEIO|nr:helicase-related protein [Deinococcus psychrotolerans]AZI45158.1 helicase [Deinococcus psychrotolerans]